MLRDSPVEFSRSRRGLYDLSNDGVSRYVLLVVIGSHELFQGIEWREGLHVVFVNAYGAHPN